MVACGLAADSDRVHKFTTLRFDLQPGSLTVQVADEHQPYRKHRQSAPSRQQVARGETEESLIPLSFPTLSLSVQPADRQGQRMQLLMNILTLDWVVDWTGRCYACCPPRARGVYSLARILQGR